MASVPTQPHLNHHVLAVLEKCSHLNHLKQLQGFLISLGHSQTQFYAFKLVRFCNLTLANLSYARFIFDHLTSPNVYLYTAMITAYASQPDPKAAFLLYRNMVRRGTPRPNHFIYPHVLKSCPEVLESHGTQLVHAQVLKSGFGRYPVVQTAIVDSYSKFCSDIGIARQMFDEMLEKNVVSWTAMISGYARLGNIDNAIALFEYMPERDVPAWNALIAGCAQNGFFCEAIWLFRRMITLSLEGKERVNKPNKITVASALSACGHTGMLHLGKWIHGYVFKYHLGQDSFMSNALLDMYGKCGNLKIARRVFDMITSKSLTSWNSLINCLALHGHCESAIDLFVELIRCGDGVKPDGVTFVGVLNACTHGGLVEKGYSYFEMMRWDYGIEPQIEHFGCLIDLLGRAGRFEEAMEVVRGMNIEPDEVVWGSLLNGCKIHGRPDLAEYSVKKLIEMDPENGGYRIMLANIYAELEKWDEVRKVRKLLKEQKAYKTPGCSWIEVDNQGRINNRCHREAVGGKRMIGLRSDASKFSREELELEFYSLPLNMHMLTLTPHRRYERINMVQLLMESKMANGEVSGGFSNKSNTMHILCYYEVQRRDARFETISRAISIRGLDVLDAALLTNLSNLLSISVFPSNMGTISFVMLPSNIWPC